MRIDREVAALADPAYGEPGRNALGRHGHRDFEREPETIETGSQI
jgi:hypothetical protein